MSTPDGLLTALADGLRRRVTERGEAEARLADFVFREGAGGTEGRLTRGGRLALLRVADARRRG